MLSFAKMMPLLSKVGHYLKLGADHYADLRSAGKEAGPEIVAAYILGQMADWHPEFQGKKLLDDATRTAGSRFLAGLVVNFAG